MMEATRGNGYAPARGSPTMMMMMMMMIVIVIKMSVILCNGHAYNYSDN